MDAGGKLSVVDQLIKGSDPVRTPAITGLTDVVFFPEQATGDAGGLNVADGVRYGVAEDAENKLADVVFTPLAAGTYSIPFTASAETRERARGTFF